jgi:hypothetical protein
LQQLSLLSDSPTAFRQVTDLTCRKISTERSARKTHIISDSFPDRAIWYLSYNLHQSDNYNACAGTAYSTVRRGRSDAFCASRRLIAPSLFGVIADKCKLLKDGPDESLTEIVERKA